MPEPDRHMFQEIWNEVHEETKLDGLDLDGLTDVQKEVILIKFRSIGRKVFSKTVNKLKTMVNEI